MTVELKPCPFCGQSAKHEVWSLQNYHRVWCGNCDVEMDYFCSLEDAAMRWNTRASQWLPIESAPTDGTRVLLCCMTTSQSTPRKLGFIAVSGYDEGGWPDFNRHHWPATHWQPLPAPPEVNS